MNELQSLLFDERYIFFLLYFIAFGASIAAFMQKSMFLLRGLIVLSSSSYVIYYFFYPAEPLWLDIITETAAVGVNLVMLILLYRQNSSAAFSEEEKELYSACFSSFSPFEFYKLARFGTWESVPAGTELTLQGEAQELLFFIYDGKVEVWQDGACIDTLNAGSFIGEISYTLGHSANATVKTAVATRLLTWKQDDLRKFLERNPSLKSKFDMLITSDLATKLS